MTTEDAFKAGYLSKSILDNPWNSKIPMSNEADLARCFVEGYVKKLQDENRISGNS